MSIDNYKGFELFNDIAEQSLRTRNRAVVLANMIVDNMREKKLSPKGVTLVLGYFNQIPLPERKEVQAALVEDMSARGFQLA
jgi:NADPH-dependent 7-cyano-7-deazaguanine reductase QueF-like protein